MKINSRHFFVLIIGVVIFGSMLHVKADNTTYRLDVPALKQTWEPWGNENLGFSSNPINQNGCALVALNMLFNYYDINLNPLQFNEWLKNNNGYAGKASLSWYYAANISDKVKFINKIEFSNVVDINKIKEELDKGYPVIVEIYTEKIGTHFVLLTGYNGSLFYMNDGSFEDTSLTINEIHGNPFEIIKAMIIYRGNIKEQVPVIDYKSKYSHKKYSSCEPLKQPKLELLITRKIILVDGKPKRLDISPQIIDGRAYIPARVIFENYNSQIQWEQRDKKLTIDLEGRSIELWIGKRGIFVNGWKYDMLYSPLIIDGRTMIPIRGVLEILDLEVQWEEKEKKIIITS